MEQPHDLRYCPLAQFVHDCLDHRLIIFFFYLFYNFIMDGLDLSGFLIKFEQLGGFCAMSEQGLVDTDRALADWGNDV